MRFFKFNYAVFVIVGVLCLLPLAVVVLGSFKADAELWAHMRTHRLPLMLNNTLMLGVGVVVFSLLLGASLAWLVSMYEFRGRRVLEWLLVLPLAIPTYVMAFAQLGVFDYTGPIQSLLRTWSGTDVQRWFALRSPVGVAWVMSLALYPYVYLLARVAFRSMGAHALEVGQSLGYSLAQSFWRVAIPMARPWLAGGAMLALMEALADFGAVSILNYDTLTTGVYQAWFALFSLPNALQIASIALLIVCFLVSFERYWRGHRAYAQAGALRLVQRKKLHGWKKYGAWLWVAWVLSCALILPLGKLLVWALPNLDTDLNASFWIYVQGSLSLAAMAAFVVTTVALLLALARRYGTAHSFSSIGVSLLTMGYAIPGTVLAVGVFVPVAFLDNWLVRNGWSAGSVLKGTVWVMLWAYTVRFLAVAFSSVDSALQGVSPQHEYAARSLGVVGWRLLAKVYVPMMRPGIWTALLMVFVDVMKEMPITLMTRPMGWDTLSVRIFALTSEGLWQEAALPALSLVLVGMIPVFLLLRDDGEKA